MHKKHHRSPFRDIRKVGLEPIQLMLGQIAQIMTDKVEYVIQHYIMDTTLVERVPGRAESALIQSLGIFVATCVTTVVVVSHKREERETGLRTALVHFRHQTAGPLACYVSAGYAEGRKAGLLRISGSVGSCLTDIIQLTFVVNLDISPDKEVVTGLVLSGRCKFEISLLSSSLTVKLTVEQRSTVALRHLISGRNGQIDKSSIRMDIKRISSQ